MIIIHQLSNNICTLTYLSGYKPTGLECHILNRQEISELHPYLFTEDLMGAIYVPEDSVVNPKKVSEVLAHLAYQGGNFFPVKSIIYHCTDQILIIH